MTRPKIQIIGLPGSGKTYQIQRFIHSSQYDVDFLDIRNFSGTYRERMFRQAIARSKQNVLAESACGVRTPGYVVAVRPPLERVYAQLLERDKVLDENYLSQLSTQMIPADCTLTMPEDLPEVLQIIFKG